MGVWGFKKKVKTKSSWHFFLKKKKAKPQTKLTLLKHCFAVLCTAVLKLNNFEVAWRKLVKHICLRSRMYKLFLLCNCICADPLQAAHLLESPKSSAEDITNISSSCFKLNSLQLRALLENYQPLHGEPRVPPELIGRLISIAQVGPVVVHFYPVTKWNQQFCVLRENSSSSLKASSAA